MKLFYPDYYPQFACLASACRDNCCIGWEIDIDDASCARYLAQPGAFGDRLRAQIDPLPTPHFRLSGAEERCPFLNRQNLCEIHIRLGEQALCRICTMHPRFAEQFGDFGEIGLGLSCEAAARLILSRKTPMRLLEVEDDPLFSEQQPFDPLLREGVFAARSHLLTLLQERSLPVYRRLLIALLYGQRLQADLETAPFEVFAKSCAQDIPHDLPMPLIHFDPCDTLGALLGVFLQMEYLDAKWHADLEDCLKQLPLLLERADEAPFAQGDWLPLFHEQFCVYLLFRYFSKSVFDGQLLTKLQLIAVSLCVLQILLLRSARSDRPWDFAAACELARRFSKEVEYSEQNMELLQDALEELPEASPLRLCILLTDLCPQTAG